MKTEQAKMGVSVVVPFLNEEEGIRLFCETVDEYAGGLDFPVELVFVNDGSTDRSAEILTEYRFRNIEQAQLINLSRNFGSHAAIRAGLTKAKHDICTWIGSDLQEPLELIPAAMEKLRNGYDVVYIEKESIVVSKANRLFSRIYSWLMKKFAVSNYSSGGISTIVFNRKIKEYLNRNIENNSSIMLQIMDAGFREITLPMHFHERSAGVSKWTLKKKIKLLIDSFVAFSFAPIRLVTIIGMALFGLGILIGLITIINKIVNPAVPGGYSTLICILSLGFGMTNISLGIVAEYLWRAYDAARGRPCFIIADQIPLDGQSGGNRMSYFAHETAIVEEGAQIGEGTRIWHHAHVRSGCEIGENCNIGKNCYIDEGAKIGNGVKIQNNVSVFHGVEIGDEVFVGPCVVFTNDLYPRAFSTDWQVYGTKIGKGASLCANSTIVCGHTVGEYATVGAGSVVTKDVPAHALVVGNPARRIGWVCRCGMKVDEQGVCPACGEKLNN